MYPYRTVVNCVDATSDLFLMDLWVGECVCVCMFVMFYWIIPKMVTTSMKKHSMTVLGFKWFWVQKTDECILMAVVFRMSDGIYDCSPS